MSTLTPPRTITRSPSTSTANTIRRLKEDSKASLPPRIESKDDLCLLSKASSKRLSQDSDSLVSMSEDDFSVSESKDNQWKQVQITRELVDTEKKFVHILTVLETFFIKPLQDKSIISQEKIEKIFGNLSEILKVQSNFLEQLLFILYKTKPSFDNSDYPFDDCTTIATLFDRYASHAQLFANYCSSHSSLLTKKELNIFLKEDKEFADFISEQLKLDVVNKQTLQSMLTTIPQRICKYPLLLREYLKTLSEDNDEKERNELQLAASKLNELLEEIDKQTKVSSDFGKLFELQKILQLPKGFKLLESKRRFIYRGDFKVTKPHQNYGSYAFLFNDILLLCKISKNDTYKVTRKIQSNSLILCSKKFIEEKDYYCVCLAEVSHGLFTVKFKEKKEYESWLKALNLELDLGYIDTINNVSKRPSTSRTNSLYGRGLTKSTHQNKYESERTKRKEAEKRVKELEEEVNSLKKRVLSQKKLIEELMMAHANLSRNGISQSQDKLVPPHSAILARAKSETTSPVSGISSPTHSPFDSPSSSSKGIIRAVKERLIDFDPMSPRRKGSESPSRHKDIPDIDISNSESIDNEITFDLKLSKSEKAAFRKSLPEEESKTMKVVRRSSHNATPTIKLVTPKKHDTSIDLTSVAKVKKTKRKAKSARNRFGTLPRGFVFSTENSGSENNDELTVPVDTQSKSTTTSRETSPTKKKKKSSKSGKNRKLS